MGRLGESELCAAIIDHGGHAKSLNGLSAQSLRHSECPLILHVAQSRAGRWYNHWVLFHGIDNGDPVILDFPHPAQAYSFADVLSISRSTVTREWQAARTWLYRRMTARSE